MRGGAEVLLKGGGAAVGVDAEVMVKEVEHRCCGQSRSLLRFRTQ